MKTTEEAVRAAAQALQDAIAAAKSEGFAVEWPSSFAALSISETAKVSEAAAEPAPVTKSKK